MEDSGYYKNDGNNLLFAPNTVFGRDFSLNRENHASNIYPIDGWYWFDSRIEALTALKIENSSLTYEIMGKTAYSVEDLIAKTKDAGGLIFEKPYLLNIIGVRDLTNPNTWNDTIVYFYYDEKGSIFSYQCDEFTTDPGKENLLNPVNKAGTAILKEGWHRMLWRLGMHHGKYSALVQNANVSVYRDKDRDAIIEITPETINNGIFGINLHRANENSIAEFVGPHSAGCQVFRKITDFNSFMKVVNLCISKGKQQFFSYMLFNKSELTA